MLGMGMECVMMAELLLTLDLLELQPISALVPLVVVVVVVAIECCYLAWVVVASNLCVGMSMGIAMDGTVVLLSLMLLRVLMVLLSFACHWYTCPCLGELSL